MNKKVCPKYLADILWHNGKIGLRSYIELICFTFYVQQQNKKKMALTIRQCITSNSKQPNNMKCNMQISYKNIFIFMSNKIFIRLSDYECGREMWVFLLALLL